jgi:hypothetical protein
MKSSITLLCLVAITTVACQQEMPETGPVPSHDHEYCETCGTAQSSANDMIYERGGRFFLWGGDPQDWHFDITGWSLDSDNLTDWGNDRESFPALIRPQYAPVHAAANRFSPGEKVLFVIGEDAVYVYPYVLMKYHEVINEVVDGVPVMIAYCYLADLAAVYSRIYCGQEFTFALSGYTYAEENIWEDRQGFVLWDRDTESLWWPLIDRAVSGLMQNTQLKKHTSGQWGLSTWAAIQNTYPEAVVMISDPAWVAPASWPAYSVSMLDCKD